MQLCSRSTAVACIVVLMLICQISSGLVPKSSTVIDKPLSRRARNTPLWRIMGTKPNGAYCQENFECATNICRKGHCSINQQFKS